MTPDLAFECLLVSRDTSVVSIVNKILDNLSISTNICLSSSSALDHLADGSPDLVIIDCEDEPSELIGNIRKSWGWRKPTVVAVTPTDGAAPGADVLLYKPVTPEACANSLKAAYSRMIHDHRRHSRYAVMSTVSATNQEGKCVNLTITDIGDGGCGLVAKEDFRSGDTLSFRLLLPGTDRAIFVEARVQWTRRYGSMGCEFLHISPEDLSVLNGWLSNKNRIKKPMVTI